MNSLVNTLTNKKLFLTATLFGWLQVEFFPNPMLIFYLAAAMAVDLLTGLLKSWELGVATTSAGFKKTVSKVTVYASVIIATWLLANLLREMYPKANIDYSPMVNLIIGLLSFIELYSVFENVNAMAPNSALSRYLARPVLRFLRGQLERADKSFNNYPPPSDDKPKDDSQGN